MAYYKDGGVPIQKTPCYDHLMEIREFTPADAEELGTLFFSTIRKINVRDYSKEQVTAWAPAERDLNEWIRSFTNKHVIVATESRKLCGFGEIELTGHIDRFFIHHEHNGQGVGRQIYDTLELFARACDISRIFVEVSITALPFFKKMGFVNPQEQKVILRGIEFTNYRMEKFL